MWQFIVNFVSLGAIYTLFALGLTLSWGALNVLNMAHGSILMFGGLVAYRITKDHSLPLYLLLPIAMAATGLVSMVAQALVFGPIRNRYQDNQGGELGILIAGIGLAALPVALAVHWTNNQSVTINPDVFPVHVVHIFGLRVLNIQVLIVAVTLVLTLGLIWFVRSSRQGRALRALAVDSRTCELLGISARRLAWATMFVSGALAGCAGVLLGIQLNVVEAHMGEPLMITAFAVIILGGVGSISGTALAALVLAAVQTAVITYVSPSLKELVTFALILLLLLVRPQGLFSQAGWQRP